METITKTQALKILGLKSNPTRQEIDKAFKKLIKTKHPDVFPVELRENKAITDEFIQIMNAYKTLTIPQKAETLSFPEYRKEYELIARNAPRYTTDIAQLQDAHIKIIQTPEYSQNEAKALKLNAALNKHLQEIEARQRLFERVQDRTIRKNILKTVRTQEQRMQDKIKKINDELQMKKDFKKTQINITKKINKKIPFLKKINGKKTITYIAVTAAVIAAILAGKYAWDHREQAFKPTGLIGGPKNAK